MDQSLSILIKQLITNSNASWSFKSRVLNALDTDTMAIYWCVEDFEHQAAMYEEQTGEEGEVYDRSQFKDALNRMISNYDCNHGISWETVDYYLDEYCRFPEK